MGKPVRQVEEWCAKELNAGHADKKNFWLVQKAILLVEYSFFYLSQLNFKSKQSKHPLIDIAVESIK